jgi:hypothetical protein
VQRFAGFELPRILVPAIASRLGITRARIRTEVGRGNWQTIARGVVLTRPDEPTREDWAGVGIAVGGPTAALSGWDAVRIRGLGDPTPPVCTVLVLIRDGRSRLVGSAWVRRTCRPYLVETTSAHAGLHPLTPVVPTARAIADAALTYSALGPVRAMVTSAVQRNACSLVELVRELDDGPQNGSYFLRRALRAAAFGAHSEAEAAATDKLVAPRSHRSNSTCQSLTSGVRSSLSLTFCGENCERHSKSTAASSTSVTPVGAPRWTDTTSSRAPGWQ